MAFFATLIGPDGKPVDPVGHGLYKGGRFGADGQFSTSVKPGKARLSIAAGPNYVPLETEVVIRPGQRTEVDVRLAQWYSPEKHGWYGGDNHVHAAHDSSGEVKSDVPYTAILARANGLSFVTQASSDFPFEIHPKQDRPGFMIRRSLENRQGSFSGHSNSPGVELPDADRQSTMHAAMPTLACVEWVHAHNAAIIHSHTMVPPTQLHWMGAAEAYSYSVLHGDVPDAMDLNGEASENLWFMVLNLGNKVSASGSTDCALERANSPMPGDRRLYVNLAKFGYDEYVQGIRAGKTIATNAGPLYAFLGIDGHGVAETIRPGEHRLKVEVQSLRPLKDVQLVRSGVVKESYEVRGLSGQTHIEQTFRDEDEGWYVIRAHDQQGNWAITSPIYVRGDRPAEKTFAASLICEIGNFTRLSEVRKTFMAHFIATVSPEDPLAKVELLRDAGVVKAWTPEDGDHVVDNKTPVTETFGEYKPGWLWYPKPTEAVRFQADWDVTDTGWYEVRATTRSGRVVVSDAFHYDAQWPMSSETSVANLFGAGIEIHHWGYGEDIELAKVDNGDHWWYPNKQYWSMSTRFGGVDWHHAEGDMAREAMSFRRTGQLTASR